VFELAEVEAAVRIERRGHSSENAFEQHASILRLAID
jgi:hypothetical protein